MPVIHPPSAPSLTSPTLAARRASSASSVSAPSAIRTSRACETPAGETRAWSVRVEGTVCAAGVTATAVTTATSANVMTRTARGFRISCVEVSTLSLSASQ